MSQTDVRLIDTGLLFKHVYLYFYLSLLSLTTPPHLYFFHLLTLILFLHKVLKRLKGMGVSLFLFNYCYSGQLFISNINNHFPPRESFN